MEPTVLVKLAADAILPKYQSEHAAGLDLHSTHEVVLQPMERNLVGTGLFLAIPPGFEGQVRPRSGLAFRHGISMVNTPGTIDADYRGEIKVLLVNLGSEVVKLSKGERIAQLVVCPVSRAALQVVTELEDTQRSSSGFGSTGTR
jgi:dUTP pyrophosphatase